jgi:hypothetical protein
LNGILVKKFYIYLINITIEKSAGIRHIASKATRNPRSPVAAKQKLDRRSIGEGGSGRSAMSAALEQSDLSHAQAVRRPASSPSRGGQRSRCGLGHGDIRGGPTHGPARVATHADRELTYKVVNLHTRNRPELSTEG